jgi:hypothetical protein
MKPMASRKWIILMLNRSVQGRVAKTQAEHCHLVEWESQG